MSDLTDIFLAIQKYIIYCNYFEMLHEILLLYAVYSQKN